MNIKLIRAFVVLAEERNYHAAAQVLCMSQPALTKQIQTIEQQLGVSLFQRGRHGSKLTREGSLFYDKSCELLKHVDEFEKHFLEIKNGVIGNLSLGFGISTFQFAPECVRVFREKNPDVIISLNDIPSNVQCKMLLESMLHGGFVRLPVPAPLASRFIFKESLVLAMPKSCVIEPRNIQEVMKVYPLLQMNPARGRGLSDQTLLFLQENKIISHSLLMADDIHTLLALIATGNGVALLPSGVKHFLPSGVELISVDGKYTHWDIGFAWNPEVEDTLRDRFLSTI